MTELEIEMHDILLNFTQELPDDDEACTSHIRRLLCLWSNEFMTAANIQKKILNHGKQKNIVVNDMDGFNEMHVVGIKLSAMLHKRNFGMYTTHDVNQEVYAHAQQLQTSTCEIRHMTWNQLMDLVTALQIEMPNLIYDEASETSSPDTNSHNKTSNIIMKVDVLKILVLCLTRVGYWVQTYWKPEDDNTTQEDVHSAPKDVLLEAVPLQQTRDASDYARTDGGWLYVERHNIVKMLDALHALLSIVLAFYGCTYVETSDSTAIDDILQNMTEHHREVSLDKFYEISMISDINPGMISQYKHRHQEVFHSVSQVVYYNWPSYQRHKQIKFDAIMSLRTPINMLPLLTEMFPTVPVIYEHDGALCRKVHSKHAYSWALINSNIFLVSRDMKLYYHKDIMQMCAIFNTGNGNST